MAVVTTYVCDVTGFSSNNEKEFISVGLKTYYKEHPVYNKRDLDINRLVHLPVAKKLGLVHPITDEDKEVATPTFESQLSILLKSYIDDLVYESVEDDLLERN